MNNNFMSDVLLYFTLKYKGDWEKIYHAFEGKEKVNMDELSAIRKKLKHNYFCIIDDEYPENLKSIYKPPFSIFYEGDKKLFNKNLFSLFGSPSEKEILDIYKNNDCVFVIEFSNKNKDQINLLLENNIKFIGVCDNNISSVNKEILKNSIDKKCLIISEHQEKSITPFSEQPWIRVSMGTSQKSIFKYSKNDYNADIALEIGKAEKVQMYYLEVCDKKIINKFSLIDSNKILEKQANKAQLNNELKN